jgi:hypothetical protein
MLGFTAPAYTSPRTKQQLYHPEQNTSRFIIRNRTHAGWAKWRRSAAQQICTDYALLLGFASSAPAYAI